MKLLDANVFIYAEGSDHPYREPCRTVLRTARADPAAFGVDVELVQEILDVYQRREGATKAVTAAASVLALFFDPFPITMVEIEQTMRLLVPRSRLSPRDAIHAAVCLTNGLEGIVSADKAFDRVPGVTRFDPLKLAGP